MSRPPACVFYFAGAANVSFPPLLSIDSKGPFRTLTGHRMPRCSFLVADINWSSNFSIYKQLSMCSYTTRTLHFSRAMAFLGMLLRCRLGLAKSRRALDRSALQRSITGAAVRQPGSILASQMTMFRTNSPSDCTGGLY